MDDWGTSAPIVQRDVFGCLPDHVRHSAIEARALAVLRTIPIEELGFVGFEYSLRDDIPGFDLFVRFSRSSGRAVRFVKHIARAGLADGVPAWQNTLAVLNAWNDARGAFADLDNFWMEFDFRASPTTIPPPSLFWHERDDQITPPLPASAPEIFSLMTVGPEELRAWHAGAARLQSICGPHLPAVAAGVMLSRNPATFRACLLSATPQSDPALATLLDKIFGGHPPHSVTDIFSLAKPLRIDVDVGHAFADRIGVEWFLDRSVGGGRDALSDALDAIGRRGWIAPDRAAGLVDFIGRSRAPADPAAPWPPSWTMVDRLRGRRSSGLGRIVHHIKFSVGRTGITDVKVYLGATPVGLP